MRKLFQHGRRCLGLVMTLLIGASAPVYATEAPPVDAGTIVDSLKERKTAIPPKANVQIEINKEKEEQTVKKEGYKIKVNAFHITGQEIYSEDKLQALIKDSVQQELTLSELEAIAGSIAKYFNEHGYMVADAYLPAQKIKNGVVEITVMPGRYDGVEIRNHSRISDKAIANMLGNIKAGDYVKKDVLERTLLLLSDVGGISIKAVLAPGKTTGTTNLVVEINSTKIVSSEFSIDNYGNRYAGKYRGNLDLHFRNLGRLGDVFNIGGNNAGNTDGTTHNLEMNYTVPVGRQGAKLGVGYSKLQYTIGQEFGALDFHGTAKTTSFFGSYPLTRSRNYNLSAQLTYDHRQLEDDMFGFAYTDKHTNVWTLGLYGDSRDNFRGGGSNSFALNIASGRLGIDGGKDENSIPADQRDRETAKTAGTYTKVGLNFNRLQYLNDHLNLFLSFTGQLAGKNLDSSEKLYLGGPNGVRAYPQSDSSGDQGYLITGELRWSLPKPGYQLAAYIDHGHVTVNKDPWPSAGDNSRTLTGAGLGVIISARKDIVVRVDYAWKLGSEKAVSDIDKNGRWWVKGVRYF